MVLVVARKRVTNLVFNMCLINMITFLIYLLEKTKNNINVWFQFSYFYLLFYTTWTRWLSPAHSIHPILLLTHNCNFYRYKLNFFSSIHFCIIGVRKYSRVSAEKIKFSLVYYIFCQTLYYFLWLSFNLYSIFIPDVLLLRENATQIHSCINIVSFHVTK